MVRKIVKPMKSQNNQLELYLHIPFCKSKCVYCDFLSAPSTCKERNQYIQALLMEIDQYAHIGKQYRVPSIFIGGGTPSILEEELLVQVFEKLREVFIIHEAAEITIEMNPGVISKEKLETYKKLGINRISMGLQSTRSEELQILGRIHTYEEFLSLYHMAREVGFENINVDLMSAVPKQTLATWEETLEKVIALQPEHISAYSLIIEEETKLYDQIEKYELLLPSEEEEREMYYRTKERLGEAGYGRYEISNYAKEGRECFHNLGYWSRENYLGIGLGSSSCIENIRYSNDTNMESYLKKAEAGVSVRVTEEVLTQTEQMEEFMFLGLRKTEGVSTQEFADQFGMKIEEVYGSQIEKLLKQELIQCYQIKDKKREAHFINGSPMWIQLTELGCDLSNQVMVAFILTER